MADIDIEAPGGDGDELKLAILALLANPLTTGAAANGASASIHAGDGGSDSGNGGGASLGAGQGLGSAASGGDVQLNGGDSATGDGGWVKIDGGGANTGEAGTVRIRAGNTSDTGNGGAVTLAAGNGGGTSGDGGDVTLTPGSATSGVKGHIKAVNLEDFADDAAAATGGVPVNGLYRTGSAVKVRVS